MRPDTCSTTCAIVVICIFVSSVFAGTYSGGSGTAANPYRISNVSDLLELAANTADYNKSFVLTNNISLTGHTFTTALIAPNPGNSYPFAGTAFTGIFQGKGNSILNLSIDTSGTSNDYLGLFGYIGSGGVIANLGIESVNIIGGDICYYTGALCGESQGLICSCYSSGTITGNLYRGGGLVGYNSGDIVSSYSIVVVTGYDRTGGLCGSNIGTITNCFATGTVNGGFATGGLCGHNDYGTLSYCFSTGSVTGGSSTGGLCGFNRNGSVITSCYFLDTAGTDNGYGDPRTAAQMKTLSNYIGWDFSYTYGDPADWFMPTNQYPVLYWQLLPANVYPDNKNNLRDFTVFAFNWLREDCSVSNYDCDHCDIDFDSDVDAEDLRELLEYWLTPGIYN
ncbi:MAG: hypothetical protein K8R02_04035 [Anaerohalosphaeraceae bacterium]|nr:hypothetical protein [Anaerohalosphaeraceae bacterium]